MEIVPKPGEFYRHFKNKMYQVIAVATHTETGERMVVYQALYGEFGVYTRPLSMFMEPVDRDKYPDAAQKYRFERIEPWQLDSAQDCIEESCASVNPLLLRFLDATTCAERIGILQEMKGRIGQQELDSLYVSLDIKACGGSADDQLENLKQYLNAQNKFDTSRLR